MRCHCSDLLKLPSHTGTWCHDLIMMLLIIFCVSYLVIDVVDLKLVIKESEWPKLTREQIVAEADLIGEFEEKDNCMYRKVRIYDKINL